MNEEFKITVGSDTDYEKLIAQIECNTGAICTISQERDDGKLEIEFTPLDYGVPAYVKCELDSFKEALEKAVKKLKGEL